VYFTAQASHLAHLARKFEAAVDAAMALTVSDRHSMTAQALARRFPVDEMMGAYADTWQQVRRGTYALITGCVLYFLSIAGAEAVAEALLGAQCKAHADLADLLLCVRLHCRGTPAQVDCCFRQAKESRQAQQQQQEQAASFFANKWERCNKGTAAGSAAAAAVPKDTAAGTAADQSSTTADRSSSRSGNNGHSSSGDNGNGSVSVDCSAFLSSFNRKGSNGSGSSSSSQLQQSAGCGSELRNAHLSRAQRLTNRLLVVLQHFSLGPGILLLSFVLLEVRGCLCICILCTCCFLLQPVPSWALVCYCWWK
jgi:hypothetical protein